MRTASSSGRRIRNLALSGNADAVPTIEKLLQRRNDLSTFLVHLTRETSESTGLENLKSMIEHQLVEARRPFGPAAHLEDVFANSPATQKAVCMTETPLEHIWMMLDRIEGRAVHFAPFGLAITKTTGRKAGFNPVWYTDITRRGVTWPSTSVNEMISDAVTRASDDANGIDSEALQSEPIFRITPYFEQMGPTTHGRKEFWWEREWRKVGDYRFAFPRRVVALLAPEDTHVELERWLVELDEQQNTKWMRRAVLDPSWGLERMIAALARVPDEEMGPFPEAD